jgi:hypothetical protein
MKDTGGPAFPTKRRIQREGYLTAEYEPCGGMTLRDYFAAKASEEDIRQHLFTGRTVEVVVERTNGRKEIDRQPEVQTREQARYAFADAMLKARQP